MTLKLRVLATLPIWLLVATCACADHIDVAASGGIGVVTVAADGQCSLREAMVAANLAATTGGCTVVADADDALTINLPANAVFTLVDGPYVTNDGNTLEHGTNGLPDVTATFSIAGHGATIIRSAVGGTPLFRLLHVASSGNLTLDHLTLSNGHAANGNTDFGGRGYNGGGIFNAGVLMIRDSAIRGNAAGDGADSLDEISPAGRGGGGGGIFNANTGTAILWRTAVDHNVAGAGGGEGAGVAFGGYGGGLSNWGTLELHASSVRDNATAGGSYASGGGIAISGLSASASISDSTVADNAATTGGGISVSGGRLTVDNSTLSGNTADSGQAGGVLIEGQSVVAFSYTTIAGNSGAAIRLYYVDLQLDHSIVAGGDADACETFNGATFESGGYNLAADASCGFAATGDRNGVDPQLGALADNGGMTATMEPAPGSPAVDAVPEADCALNVPAGSDASTDQRGMSRPFGAGCDIGAVERHGATLLAVAGSGQTATVWSPFLNPLLVKVRWPGSGAVGVGVTVRARPAAAGQPGAICADGVSDSAGDALLYCRANGVAGGPYKVAIDAVDGVGPAAVFQLRNEPSIDLIFTDGFDPPGPMTLSLGAGVNALVVDVPVPASLPTGEVRSVRVVRDARGKRVVLVQARRHGRGTELRLVRYAHDGRVANVGPWQPATSHSARLHVAAGASWIERPAAAQ